MALTLNEHIGKEVRDKEHRNGLLRMCDHVREETGAEIGNARLKTNAELKGSLGYHCNGVIELNADRLLKHRGQLAEAAVTSMHEGLHYAGRRKNGKRGKGIRHEGITEAGAQKLAIQRGYRGFSTAYARSVKGAEQIANLITFDKMMEVADQGHEAPVLLQREITRALVKKHSMPPKQAVTRAKEMEKAAA